jgi:hypothetical protein
MQFDLLCGRQAERDKIGFLQAGIIAATVCNLFRGKDDKPISPVDFVPGKKSEESNDQSAEEQVAALRRCFRPPQAKD